jgi:hypothetical protein
LAALQRLGAATIGNLREPAGECKSGVKGIARIQVKALLGFGGFGPMAWGEARFIRHESVFESRWRSSHANLELASVRELMGPREAHR